MDEIRNYRGSTPLASKLLFMKHLHLQNGVDDNKSDNISIFSRWYPLAFSHTNLPPRIPPAFSVPNARRFVIASWYVLENE
jgi:hypothetical protein